MNNPLILFRILFTSLIRCLRNGYLAFLLINSAFALPQINIIIDDLGNNVHHDMPIAMLPGAVTCSILPYRVDSDHIAQVCHEQNKEIIVHVPMEANRELPMGAGGLSVTLSPEALQNAFLADVNSIPYRIGFNNHMGSRLTRDRDAMETVMAAAKPLNIFYIDSLTDPRSVSGKTARADGIPTLDRDIFLDDIRTPDAVEHQFQELIRVAKEHGYAIAIGHPYPVTIAMLQQEVPNLAAEGVELVPLSTLVQGGQRDPR